MRAYSKSKWHVDEVFVKVNGKRHSLWRAVDHEGEVLEALVTRRRNKLAALKFLKKLMKRHGTANEVITDRFASYRAALKDLEATEKQKTGRWLKPETGHSRQVRTVSLTASKADLRALVTNGQKTPTFEIGPLRKQLFFLR